MKLTNEGLRGKNKKKTAALTVCVLVLMCLAACQPIGSGSSGLVISEVVASNNHTYISDTFGTPDWIELANTGSDPIDITGYILRRTGSASKTYYFPEYTIRPGEYLVVAACEGADRTDELYTGFKLPKEGCGLVLQNADGITIGEMVVPELETDMSYALHNGTYMYCITPTPGAENAGTLSEKLEELASEAPTGLVLNEAARYWIELYNSSDTAIDLSHFYLSEDMGDPLKWRLPDMELGAGEYLVVRTDATGEIYTDFTVNENEAIICLSAGTDVLDTLTLPRGLTSISAGRTDSGDQAFYTQPTPGAQNGGPTTEAVDVAEMTDEDKVRINEILLDNATSLIDEDGDRGDWVEIYNGTDESVDLSRYAISDDPGAPDRWRLPAGELEAGGYAVIFIDGKGRDSHADFNVGTGEPLVLIDMETLRMETVYVAEESRLQNISYGIKDGQWLYFGLPTPGKANTSMGYESITNVEKLDKSGIWISEVSSVQAARSGKLDWVELYNPGSQEVSLEGWRLGDDLDEQPTFALKGSIGAGEYRLVYCTANTSEQKEDRAPFGISSTGQELVLTDAVGGIVDYFETGSLSPDVTSGRDTGVTTGERLFFTEATPGSANGQGLKGYCTQPAFSESAGYVTGESLTVAIEGVGTIRYTTDGSEPTESSPIYDGPLTLTENTVLKAKCFEEGRLASPYTTATYLFEEKHTLPVVCMSISESDLRYVYSMTEKSMSPRERECHIEYFEADGTQGTAFSAGVMLGGNSTRNYAQRTFNLYLRGAYGQSSVVYPFFEDYPITEFTSLTLRNAGQNGAYSRITDAFANQLVRDMDVDYAETRFVIVYLNGSYHGIYDLKENQNEDFFAARHGIDPDKVNTIRRNVTALAGTNRQVKEVYALAKRYNLKNQDNYDKFVQYVDAEGWIDYIIARSFTGDNDMFNQKLWNTNDYTARWRPVFYDCDYAFAGGSTTLPQYFTGEGVASPDGTLTNMYIPTALKTNEAWRERFIERYAECINTIFVNAPELLDEMVAQLEPEMERHIKRWGKPSGMKTWEGYIDDLRRRIDRRVEVAKKSLKSYFGLSDERMEELFG